MIDFAEALDEHAVIAARLAASDLAGVVQAARRHIELAEGRLLRLVDQADADRPRV